MRSGPRGLALSFALAGASFVYYFASVRLRHAQYDTYAFDLGLLTQVTWNTVHGRWFETTVLPFNYLAEHLSPALVLAAPLLLVWPNAQALLVLQSLAIALAGVGVYLVALERSQDRWVAMLVQLAYVVAPQTGWMARDEFHPITLAMPAMAFAAWFLWRGRFAAAALLAALALLANEDAALVVAPFGLLIAAAARGYGRMWGAGLASFAAGWLAIYLFSVAPLVRPPELAALPQHNFRHYLQCGTALSDIVRCLLDPNEVAPRLTTPGDAAALVSSLLPTLGLAVLGPSFLVTIPRWMALLLGNDPPPYQLHYAALLVTGAYLAVGEALGPLGRLHPAAPRLAADLVVAASFIAFAVGGPLPGGGAYEGPTAAVEQRNRLMDQAIALVPSDQPVTVAATNKLLPHLAARPVVVFPVESRCPDPDIYAVDLRDGYPYTEAALRRVIERVRLDPAYVTLFSEDDVLVLRWAGASSGSRQDDRFGDVVRMEGLRRLPSTAGLDLEIEWRKEGPAAPDYHYFVHLVDSTGAIFSQADGQLRGARLGHFIDGCRARERVSLAAPPEGQWSAYRLRIGWYEFDTGVRVRLADGRDYVEVELDGLTA